MGSAVAVWEDHEHAHRVNCDTTTTVTKGPRASNHTTSLVVMMNNITLPKSESKQPCTFEELKFESFYRASMKIFKERLHFRLKHTLHIY